MEAFNFFFGDIFLHLQSFVEEFVELLKLSLPTAQTNELILLLVAQFAIREGNKYRKNSLKTFCNLRYVTVKLQSYPQTKIISPA